MKRGWRNVVLGVLLSVLWQGVVAAADTYSLISWQTTKLAGEFFCEGAHHGDFNKDGKADLVIGPFWYEGPEFKVRHAYREIKKFDPNGYSDNFLTYAFDVDGDGWQDILVIGWPGFRDKHEHVWHRNPQGKDELWPRHLAFKVVDNESPRVDRLLSNGRQQLIFHTGGRLGWAEPDAKDPTAPWLFHTASPGLGLGQYTHGIGIGDVDGDGRADFLEARGWWQQPASLDGDPDWQRHAFSFGSGGAQMYAYDVDGDGDNDVITSLAAHGYGLAWFEHVKENGQITFKQHRITGSKPEENRYGVKFSQLHAVDLVDIDGDGVKDIVTGKRYWAHGPKGDAEPDAPAVLYWFRTVRGVSAASGGVDFVPQLVHDDSGVGTQVTTADVTGDGLPDIVVGNKKGSFVHVQSRRQVGRAEWEAAQPKPRE